MILGKIIRLDLVRKVKSYEGVGINVYGYVGNRPGSRYDPFGLEDPPSFLDGIKDKEKARELCEETAKRKGYKKNKVDQWMRQWEKKNGTRKSGLKRKWKKFKNSAKAAGGVLGRGLKRSPIIWFFMKQLEHESGGGGGYV